MGYKESGLQMGYAESINTCYNCGTDVLEEDEYYCDDCEPDEEKREEFRGYLDD